jgi:hypothetical protein
MMTSRPLQNRVNPFGDLEATTARGTLMGNRGRLHDASRHIVRRIVGGYRAWVTCVLEFRGRHRSVMTPGRYTELFFLDEVTALAAGHRPCGECRRNDLERFRAAWRLGNADRGVAARDPIAAIDREMHRDRVEAGGRQRTFTADVDALPDGVVVLPPGDRTPWLVWKRFLSPWTADGYGPPAPRPSATIVTVLTPRSTMAAIAAGYVPQVHPTLRHPRERPS